MSVERQAAIVLSVILLLALVIAGRGTRPQGPIGVPKSDATQCNYLFSCGTGTMLTIVGSNADQLS